MLRRALFLLLSTAGPAVALELDLPIGCTPGKDCFIQQYVDRDPGSGLLDYACGAETYEGHHGTDIRLRTTADVDKGVAVLASAPGVVIRTRDGTADRLVRTDEDRAAVGARECSNGARIDHGGGWVTQYCHMRQGSVTVREGDTVARGAKLGEVGYSGLAMFPHVHLSVTKDSETVDPFLADAATACGASGPSLWSAAATAALGYQAGALLGFGVTDRPLTLEELAAGVPLAAPTANAPVVVYVWAINLQKSVFLHVLLRHEGIVLAENAKTLERNKAQYMLFAGKKAPQGGWPTGTYTGEVKVVRGGKAVISETTTIELN